MAIPLWGGCAFALVGSFTHSSAQAQTPAEEAAPTSQPAVPTVSGGRIVRPTLQLGSQGESVRELQSMLILLGYYPGQVTGLYQEDTATATRRFQTAAGITADGIVGPATWSRLFPTPPSEANPPAATTTDGATPVANSPAANTPPTSTPSANTPPASTPPASTPPTTNNGNAPALPVLRPGMEGDVVRQLQQRLRAKGFYNGAIDGIFGSQTEASVRRAQAANNLTVDGIVGPATWRALN
ncbi:peptidoglycan-binding protein [Nodosilinea sp. LEGE 06152]|uniref:peptidoglycan-binding domain-containing protein n=1 Tax=Nodosilinea sp. LEGE 06152 TaxID=2777966 RepID=UPI0018816591|nr:peptidoglycan-binding protein [Nodosilinea sp. LEGE 06152]MBE9159170.1 peptidoglycan-binding protein [Nodosilinea sp. LEGE 06152]